MKTKVVHHVPRIKLDNLKTWADSLFSCPAIQAFCLSDSLYVCPNFFRSVWLSVYLLSMNKIWLKWQRIKSLVLTVCIFVFYITHWVTVHILHLSLVQCVYLYLVFAETVVAAKHSVVESFHYMNSYTLILPVKMIEKNRTQYLTICWLNNNTMSINQYFI